MRPATLEAVRDPGSGESYPRNVLTGSETALILFAAGFHGRQDGFWIAEAGMRATCVDIHSGLLGEMAALYPADWEFVEADVFAYAAASEGRWDLVSLDPSSNLFERCADLVDLWCGLARRTVVLGCGADTKIAPPVGWVLTDMRHRSNSVAGGVYWAVLERAVTASVDIVSYYDNFRDRLVEDYEIGNRRVVAALGFAKEALADSRSILDVGCGVGWSSFEMASAATKVVGLDVSPVLVETARQMFGRHCRFEIADFATYEPQEAFDAVLMIDVYEHFSRDVRPRVHERIRQTRARRIALTVPTPQTQQYARDHGIPLQPVDEDIADEDIARLADDVGGRVVTDRLVEIWRPYDYRHVLIEVKS